jgi:hypothetical protein
MPMLATRELARRYEIAVARGNAERARETKADLQRHLNDMVRALRGLLEIGTDKAFLYDTAAGLHDAATKVEAACFRDIDEAGQLAGTEGVDLSELNALIEAIANGFAPAGKEVRSLRADDGPQPV